LALGQCLVVVLLWFLCVVLFLLGNSLLDVSIQFLEQFLFWWDFIFIRNWKRVFDASFLFLFEILNT
jgi:hypothetical protein